MQQVSIYGYCGVFSRRCDNSSLHNIDYLEDSTLGIRQHLLEQWIGNFGSVDLRSVQCR